MKINSTNQRIGGRSSQPDKGHLLKNPQVPSYLMMKDRMFSENKKRSQSSLATSIQILLDVLARKLSQERKKWGSKEGRKREERRKEHDSYHRGRSKRIYSEMTNFAYRKS